MRVIKFRKNFKTDAMPDTIMKGSPHRPRIKRLRSKVGPADGVGESRTIGMSGPKIGAPPNQRPIVRTLRNCGGVLAALISFVPRGFPRKQCDLVNFSKAIADIYKCRISFSNGGGVRPPIVFRRQAKVEMPGQPWIYEVVLSVLSEVDGPISFTELWPRLVNLQYWSGNNQEGVIGKNERRQIRAFLESSPIVYCEHDQFWLLPLENEVDLFGSLYFIELFEIIITFRENAPLSPALELIAYLKVSN
jgi:hypothetical protein